ncbi:MAG: acyl-CoA dehydrogenase [Nitrososphaeria archaeon]|nr:acyl-CoA dehydrogenase [Nitrososphaeria archaeon]NIN52922.1 acyl-CoA dehydrogenase [Nitrososphaeria archaeon]NIQ33481.1 acyl-CoA dehydrogenase [Nitrososphaeria archaeon]
MSFRLNAEQVDIKTAAREFCEREVKPIAAQVDRDRQFPMETIRKMAPLGFMGMAISQEYGGCGFGTLENTLVIEEVSRCCASTGATVVVHNAFVCPVIERCGTEEQKRKFLIPLAQGEKLGAYALTEPDSGSDISSIRTRAQLRDEKFVVNGSKCFVTNGGKADIYIVFAKGEEGFMALIAERGHEELFFGKPERLLGMRATSTSSLYLNDCMIPRENLIGRPGQALEIAKEGLVDLRIGIAAQAVGIAQAALETSVGYAGQRVQFGQPIGRFQAIQRMLVDMATEIEAARSLIYRCAAMRDRGEDSVKEASMAKLFASEVAVRSTKKAIKVHGGYGYMRDFPLERFARDARVTAIYGDPSEIQRNIIANILLGYKD